MSTYLYGTLTRKRLNTSADAPLVFAQADASDDGRPEPLAGTGANTQEVVGHWQDALAALVPAEVLAFHGIAMTVGTTTSGSGDDTTTVITDSTEMLWIYWGLVVAAFALYLAGAKSLKLGDFMRAVVASCAFVLWTMIQPSTAFDALDWNPSTLIRLMVALGGAAGLVAIVNALATRADNAKPK